jgi:hypothetical protein
MLDALPLNWELILSPVNWIIIILMLVIAGMTLHFFLPSLNNPF